ncbi:multicopper oxidase domain-containing protein [Microbacterium hominis]|uniref:Multicopper oxidase domain-containing protein n=2 Tax=Microbacterium hominis TaxID=162426 RepID=A0A7D4UAC2_9MICO|nr:multicopper oxidase domain-containing protein [Microbacterium hominis]
MTVTRREMMTLTALAGVAAAGAAALTVPWGAPVAAGTPSQLASKYFPKRFAATLPMQPVLMPTRTDVDEQGPVNYYDVSQVVANAKILPGGLLTPVLAYNGLVPGPRIDIDQGTRAVLRMRNRLTATHPVFGTPIATSTHLHGSASLPEYDGYASDITLPGQMKDYHYPNFQVARTLWYHDHGVHYTAQNAYSGLAAQYHLHDAQERSLLPQSEFDVALTICDMMFQADGSQLYEDRSHSGLYGDVILVNGTPWPVMKVKRRVYRFRILNSSISRSYRPQLSPSTPMHVVATDGGLMPKTQSVSNFRIGSAERYEVLIDFSQFKAGQRIEMRNLSNPNNRDYDFTGQIMAFDVVDDPFTTDDPSALSIPGTLNPGNEVMALTEKSGMIKRNIRVERDDVTNMWQLNEETWDDVVASDYTATLGDPTVNSTEVWEIENKSGGWFHPVHIHLIDFKILSRNGKAPFSYELGPKDVVYVGEGEKVRVLAKFGPHAGRYMVHCHNLVHEDHDMMHQFRVWPADGSSYDPHHPILAAPPVPDDGA